MLLDAMQTCGLQDTLACKVLMIGDEMDDNAAASTCGIKFVAANNFFNCRLQAPPRRSKKARR